MTYLAIWGAPGPQIFHAPVVIPPVVIAQPGPVDDRIADTAFRRKKKRRIEALAQNSDRVTAIAVLPTIAVVPRSIKSPDFRSLAELSGRSVEAFRAEVDQEIAQLLAAQQERDDEEALTLILAALED